MAWSFAILPRHQHFAEGDATADRPVKAFYRELVARPHAVLLTARFDDGKVHNRKDDESCPPLGGLRAWKFGYLPRPTGRHSYFATPHGLRQDIGGFRPYTPPIYKRETGYRAATARPKYCAGSRGLPSTRSSQ